MKRLDKRIIVGTSVKVFGSKSWHKVSEVQDRRWVRLSGIVGMFQRGHIEHFSNRA